MGAGPGHAIAIGRSSLQGGWSELETNLEEAGTRSVGPRAPIEFRLHPAGVGAGNSVDRCLLPFHPSCLPIAWPPWLWQRPGRASTSGHPENGRTSTLSSPNLSRQPCWQVELEQQGSCTQSIRSRQPQILPLCTIPHPHPPPPILYQWHSCPPQLLPQPLQVAPTGSHAAPTPL